MKWNGIHKFTNLELLSGGRMTGFGIAPRGKIYYVLGGESGTVGDDTNDGLGWNTPLATVTKALTLATDYDTIVMGANTTQKAYLEGATLTITQDGLKLFGAMTCGWTWGLPNIHTHGTETLIKIDAHATELAYFGFHDQGAGCSLEIAVTGDYWRNHVHDCYFGGNSAALYGVVMGNTTASGVGASATVDAPCTVVERCHFQDYATASIFMNCGYGSRVEDCDIQVNTGLVGIVYYTDGTSRPQGYILNNRFSTIDSSNAVGIQMTNTPTAGYLFIDGNHFANFADDDHCCELRTGLVGINWNKEVALTSTT
jgi:hypothetical protein